MTALPLAAWREVLWRTYSELSQDRVILAAAGVAFYTIFALAPGLTALVSLCGFFGDPATLSQAVDRLEGLAPTGGLDVLRKQLQRLAQQGRTTLGLTSLAALGASLERQRGYEIALRDDEPRL